MVSFPDLATRMAIRFEIRFEHKRPIHRSLVQSQSCNVFAVTDEPEASSTGEATLLKRLEQIEKQLEQVAKGNRSARNSSSQKASSNQRASTLGEAGRGKSDSGDGKTVRLSPETQPCIYCKEPGHWCWDCPKRKARGRPTEEANVQTVLAVSTNLSPTKIYVTAEVNCKVSFRQWLQTVGYKCQPGAPRETDPFAVFSLCSQ